MSRKVLAACAVFCSAFLGACGGGGDDGTKATTQSQPNVAIGGWEGMTTAGESLGVVVLDSGEVWGLVVEAGLATGVFHAPTSGTLNSAFTANESRIYYFGSKTSVPGTITGTVNASTLSGTAASADGSVGFNLAKSNDYDVQATLAALVGVWSGSTGDLQGVVPTNGVAIQANGTFSYLEGACTVKGVFKTLPGIAAYDVTAKYAKASGCATDQELRGMAILSDNGQLNVGLINADRSNAGLVILKK